MISELLNSIESNFIFNENPINRLKNTPTIKKKIIMILMKLIEKKNLSELKLMK